METKIHSGDAGYSLYENSVIQAQSRTAYHIGGGHVSRGSDTSQITVAVESGEASINDQTVSWAFEEVILPPGGESASGPDTNDPRVDVVFAKVDASNTGALDVAQGVAAPYAPDTKIDDSGTEVPYQPAPLEHWQPAPNDGSRVGGVVLALVLVEGSDSVASDVTNQDIKNFKVGAAGTSAYVRGDGTPTGPIEMAVDNDPVTMTDQSAPDTGAFFEYDPANGEVVLGTDDAKPTLGAPLNTNKQSLQFDSSGDVFKIIDTNPNASGEVMAFGEQIIATERDIEQNGTSLTKAGSVQFAAGTQTGMDFTANNDGVVNLWEHTNPGSGDTWRGISAPGANTANPSAFSIENATTGTSVFYVGVDGAIGLQNARIEPNGDLVVGTGGSGAVKNVNTIQFHQGSQLGVRENDGALIFTDDEGNSTVIADSP